MNTAAKTIESDLYQWYSFTGYVSPHHICGDARIGAALALIHNGAVVSQKSFLWYRAEETCFKNSGRETTQAVGCTVAVGNRSYTRSDAGVWTVGGKGLTVAQGETLDATVQLLCAERNLVEGYTHKDRREAVFCAYVCKEAVIAEFERVCSNMRSNK